MKNTRTHVSVGPGVRDVLRHHTVGLTGFEPATPCSRSVLAFCVQCSVPIGSDLRYPAHGPCRHLPSLGVVRTVLTEYFGNTWGGHVGPGSWIATTTQRRADAARRIDAHPGLRRLPSCHKAPVSTWTGAFELRRDYSRNNNQPVDTCAPLQVHIAVAESVINRMSDRRPPPEPMTPV